MFPYWLLFGVFAAGTIQTQRFGVHRQLFVAAGFLILLMISFRYEVGGDWGNYLGIFDSIRYMELGEVLLLSDPAYGLLNWIAVQIGVDIWFVNLVCGSIFTWGLIRFAQQQANPWLTTLVAIPYLVIVVAMGYTRQAVALGFILAALARFDRFSPVRFGIYVLVAAAFHKSAVLVVPLVAMALVRRRIIGTAVLGLTAVLMYYLFVDASVDRMMTNYVDAEYNSEGAAIRVAMNIPPAILFFLFRKRFELTNEQQKLWRNFAIGAFLAVTLLYLSTSTAAVDRIALYLIPLQLFIFGRLPYALGSRGGTSGVALIAVLAYSAAVQFVWLNYADHAYAWVPYQLYPVDSEPGLS
jgi:hypothetical protein